MKYFDEDSVKKIVEDSFLLGALAGMILSATLFYSLYYFCL